jgi:predicted RNase H-like HicB family nuclease
MIHTMKSGEVMRRSPFLTREARCPAARCEAFSSRPVCPWETEVKYPVLLHKDPDSDYGVTVPDLPGCFSAGASFEEALQNAQEAVLTHLEGLLLDNEPLPPATSIDKLMPGRDDPGAVWALVNVDLAGLTDKAKRVNITVPERMLRKIDAFAGSQGETRSGLLVAAALAYIAQSHRSSAPVGPSASKGAHRPVKRKRGSAAP